MIKATYVDHMGSDLSVVNAARVSFGKTSEMEPNTWGPPTLKKRDTKLIQYLAKHGHISPFGHAFVSFHCQAPIYVARQLVKHKFLRWNEVSRRYVDDEPEFYVPEVWRGRSADKKQGSEGQADTTISPDYINNQARMIYKNLLDNGVAPEQARMVLPQSTMTEWYWSGSLDAFADMCRLRCASDTQAETQRVASDISLKMEDLFPVAWEALIGEDYAKA